MRTGFYPKLAWTGIRNNRKLYFPYLLTCVGTMMVYYIVAYLANTDVLSSLPGSWALRSMLDFGSWVIAIFSFLLLLYCNTFLMRRRKKEFGLYNILGMDKKNLGLVLFWETLITAGISIVLGLIGGFALSKAAELAMVNMMGGDVTYRLTISGRGVALTLAVYGAIFGVILLRSLWQIRKTSAINLLRSENVGEKLPRFYWLWGSLGAVLLIAAYAIALSIKEPLTALMAFFIAVIMVIVATYLLFASGSVLLCKLLQRNKRYYYKPNHFISVSSMTYRMTRNGAGLASICILLTMVLVMLSSTSCLYFGTDDALSTRYIREFTSTTHMDDLSQADDDALQPFRDYVQSITEKNGANMENVLDYRRASVSGMLIGDEIETDPSKYEGNLALSMGGVRTVNFVPLEDYNRMTGTEHSLAPGEAMVYSYRSSYDADTLTIRDGLTLRVRETLDTFPVDNDAAMSMITTMYVVIPDFVSTLEPLAAKTDSSDRPMLTVCWFYGFDVDADEKVQMQIYRDLHDDFSATGAALPEDSALHMESRAVEREDFFGTFGGLFMLGIVLSVVFIFAAVLIIYYKQVTEGYEDQSRFEIMQKVGMTKKDIRKSINSQMLTIFFLPLLTAGLHLAFAFPMIRMLLLMFNMANTNLFIATTVISYLASAFFYTLVYKITSNAYYDIVSGSKEIQ